MSVLSKDQPNKRSASADDLDQVERALIDASARTPILCFFTTALVWLMVQTTLWVIASLKLHWPEFLESCSWLTYGRVVPAQNNLMIYGWASLAGIGVTLWILARLCRVALPRPGLLLGGLGLWNVGLIAGTLEVLSGNGRGFEYLDYPGYAYALLLISYALIGSWGIVLFLKRRPGHVYISTWYFVGSLLWFPWLLASANLLVSSQAIPGAMQAVVGAWFAQNIIMLWLSAIALGAIYYLIPKVLGRPIHSYYLASFGFWTFAIFSVWNGVQRLTGGPVPAWMVTTGVVAAILLLIPVATVTANYWLTMQGRFNLVYHSPTIRFVFFGAIAYTVANVVSAITSFRSVGTLTQHSVFSMGLDQMFVFAFFSMVIFGAMYYIVPRLVGCEWLSASFIKLHFWGSAYGFGMAIIMTLLAGLSQGGLENANPAEGLTTAAVDFMATQQYLTHFIRGRTIGLILLCVGQLFFALHFLFMLLRLGRPSGSQPTLFEPIQEGAK